MGRVAFDNSDDLGAVNLPENLPAEVTTEVQETGTVLIAVERGRAYVSAIEGVPAFDHEGTLVSPETADAVITESQGLVFRVENKEV